MNTMTPVSAQRRHARLNPRLFFTVARVSLGALPAAVLAVTSCLVTEAGDFPMPVETPPFVDTNTAVARVTSSPGPGEPAVELAPVALTSIVRVDDNTQTVTFSAEVNSEDAGRSLTATVYVNYKVLPPPDDYLVQRIGTTLPPGTFDEKRTISATLSKFEINNLDNGCYQIALVVSHAFDNLTNLPVRQSDTAILVWWMLKGDPSQVTFADCPSVPPSGQDGGLGLEGGL